MAGPFPVVNKPTTAPTIAYRVGGKKTVLMKNYIYFLPTYHRNHFVEYKASHIFIHSISYPRNKVYRVVSE